MPLFVFVSGLVLSYSCVRKNCAEKYSKFSYSKFKQLIIPFIVLGIIVFPFRAIMSFCADDSMPLSVGAFVESLLYSNKLSITFFWFLPMIYICQLVGYGVKKLKNVVIFSALCIIAVMLHFFNYLGGLSLFSINYVGVYLIYFMIGMLCGNNILKFRNTVKWHSPYVLALTLSAWGISYYVCYNIANTDVMRFVCAMCGISMMVSVACVIEYYNVRILDHLEGATYMIFLLSWFFNVGSQQLLHHFTDFPWQVYSAISIVTAIYIPVCAYKYIKHNPSSIFATKLAWVLGHSARN